MKKMLLILMSCLMVLSLAACDNGTADNTQPSESTAATEATGESAGTTEESTGAVEESTAPTETTAADLKALAESCIDKPLQELIDLIGEPISSDYADSCLNPGVGEDGNLFYDGFVVYTYREGDEEVVTYVE